MNPIKWIVGWWQYSRIVFLNGLALIVAAIPDIIGYAADLDYDAFFQHEIAILVAMGVNVASIILRVKTTGPVGQYQDPAVPTPITDDDNVPGADHYTGDSNAEHTE